MAETLRESIEALTAAWRRDIPAEKFVNDNGRGFTIEEMAVFGVAPDQIPRLMVAWEAWLQFLRLVDDGIFHTHELIAKARAEHPELTDPTNRPELWTIFARDFAGLTAREAEAMYWKDWFWTVRHGHADYPDEARSAAAAS